MMRLLGRTCALLSISVAVFAATPPTAPERPVLETHFGTPLSDPYRYFENVKDPEVMTFLESQARYAEAALASIPGRQKVLQRVTDLSQNAGDVVSGVVERADGKLFYLRRGAADNQYKLYWRAGPLGAEHLLVDPEKLQAKIGTPVAVNYFVPSWDGAYVAYGLSAGGSEFASLYVLETATGRQRGTAISRAVGGGQQAVAWSPDSRSVLYNRLQELAKGAPPEEFYRNSTVYKLKVGSAESAAVPIFSAKLLPALELQPGDYATLTTSPDSRWVIATVNDTTDEQYQLFVAAAADLGKPAAQWRRLARVSDGVRHVELHGDELFMLTHSGAPNFRIVRLNLRQGGFADSVELVPQQAGAIQSFTVTREALYFVARDAFNNTLRRASLDDKSISAVPLPISGDVELVDDDAHQRSGVLAFAESWTEASRLYAWDPSARAAKEWPLARRGDFSSAADIEVTEERVPGADGVLIPLTILSKRGMALNASNPTILYGYGGYGLTFDPFFDPSLYAWLERGGVFAVAAVRGGGELGDAWHRAGFKESKPNTWKDGIACAEYLIAHKYTSPAYLAAQGASAGGIFVGRVLTARPDLLRAAIDQVGITDATRAEFSANGATNISELGTVSNADEFYALLDMSSYDHIVAGTSYPAVLIAHGLNDPRVDIWHSLKFAARLQKATASGRPVLLRVEQQGGHGIGSTRLQRLAETADIYAFLWWQMGDAEFQPARE